MERTRAVRQLGAETRNPFARLLSRRILPQTPLQYRVPRATKTSCLGNPPALEANAGGRCTCSDRTCHAEAGRRGNSVRKSACDMGVGSGGERRMLLIRNRIMPPEDGSPVVVATIAAGLATRSDWRLSENGASRLLGATRRNCNLGKLCRHNCELAQATARSSFPSRPKDQPEHGCTRTKRGARHEGVARAEKRRLCDPKKHRKLRNCP